MEKEKLSLQEVEIFRQQRRRAKTDLKPGDEDLTKTWRIEQGKPVVEQDEINKHLIGMEGNDYEYDLALDRIAASRKAPRIAVWMRRTMEGISYQGKWVRRKWHRPTNRRTTVEPLHPVDEIHEQAKKWTKSGIQNPSLALKPLTSFVAGYQTRNTHAQKSLFTAGASIRKCKKCSGSSGGTDGWLPEELNAMPASLLGKCCDMVQCVAWLSARITCAIHLHQRRTNSKGRLR